LKKTEQEKAITALLRINTRWKNKPINNPIKCEVSERFVSSKKTAM
jgi:hypothetical protein